jgi:hypothetical protein
MDHYWGRCRSCKALGTLAPGSMMIIYDIPPAFPKPLKDRDFVCVHAISVGNAMTFR